MKKTINIIFVAAVILLVAAVVVDSLYSLAPVGYWFPIIVMTAYLMAGIKLRGKDVSDEHFGDSCYYLGFIALMVVGVACLFDMQHISGTAVSIIARRLGGALACIAMGVGVRIYYVGFKPNLVGALDNAEEKAMTAAGRLAATMEQTVEKMAESLAYIGEATRHAIDGVQGGITQQVEDQKKALGDLVDSIKKELANPIGDLSTAGRKLADSTMGNAQAFAEAARLIMAHGDTVSESLDTLKNTLAQVSAHSTEIGGALERITAVAGEQVKILENTQGQANVMEKISQVLESTRKSLGQTSNGVKELKETVGRYVENSQSQLAEQRGTMERLADICESQSKTQQTFTGVVEAVKSQIDATQRQQTALNGLIEHSASASTNLTMQTEALRAHVEDSSHHYNSLSDTVAGQQQALQAAMAGIAAQQGQVARSIEQQAGVTQAVQTQTAALKNLVQSGEAQTQKLIRYVETSQQKQLQASDAIVAQSRELRKQVETGHQQYAGLASVVQQQNEQNSAQSRALVSYVESSQKLQLGASKAIEVHAAEIGKLSGQVIEQGRILREQIKDNQRARQQNEEVAASVVAQTDELIRHIESSREQFALQTGTLKEQVVSGQRQYSELSNLVLAQTESLIQTVADTRQLRENMSLAVEAQNEGLRQFIENSRRESVGVLNAVAAQTDALSQQTQSGEQRYAGTLAEIKAQSEALAQFAAQGRSRHEDDRKRYEEVAAALAESIGKSRQERDELLNSVLAQTDELTKHVEAGRAQYAGIAEVVHKQGEALARQIEAGREQDEAITQRIAAQNQAIQGAQQRQDGMLESLRSLTAGIESIQKRHEDAAGVLTLQSKALMEQIELGRRQFAEVSGSAETGRQQYAEIGSRLLEQGEALQKSIESGRKLQSDITSTVLSQTRAFTDHVQTIRKQVDSSLRQHDAVIKLFDDISKQVLEQGEALKASLENSKRLSTAVEKHGAVLELLIKNKSQDDGAGGEQGDALTQFAEQLGKGQQEMIVAIKDQAEQTRKQQGSMLVLANELKKTLATLQGHLDGQ
ncbi:MAG: hypothetical protein LBI92_09180 [Azoarcus sp.]|jgi:ABC-type transporter Mla subunit MlaD|nr:hypothetical protein [Azoarcus sp.]